MSDKEIPSYTDNFNKEADTYKTELKIAIEDITILNNTALDFQTKLNASVAAQIAATEAVVAKNNSRKALEETYKEYIAKFQADKQLPDTIRAALKITIKDTTPTPRIPHQPQDLVVKGIPEGENQLNWDAGENKPGMMYQIEAQTDVNVGFVLVDVVTKTKYDHKHQTPGVRVDYRVRAKRDDELSIPSNIATVYPDNNNQ